MLVVWKRLFRGVLEKELFLEFRNNLSDSYESVPHTKKLHMKEFILSTVANFQPVILLKMCPFTGNILSCMSNS